MTTVAKELEFWMTNLPDRLRTIPVVHLAIPGSHDSTTFGINQKSNISPDARKPIQYLKFLEPILRPVIIKWSKTQTADITEQLNSGIRYFDLRIAMKPNSLDFYFVHNLYSESVNSTLQHINYFLGAHSNEIVIIDCQHFFNLTSHDHQRLVSLFTSIFGSKLLPHNHSLSQISLDYMTKQHGYQVILIYRDDIVDVHNVLWPSACFPTPWPNTVNITELITYLNNGLKNRNCALGFVSQCVLTPTVWFAFKHFFGSLKSQCVLPLEQEKYNWLQQQKPGNKGLNVVISDFVEYQDYQFPKEVISLNQKLLEQSKEIQ